MRERYAEQVRLLLDVLPAVTSEAEFALKGGTAINFFHRDLPRLSVDIDLTFLPVRARPQSLADINAGMDRIATGGAAVGGVCASRIAGGGGGATRVLFQRGASKVKVETSPVMRGAVFEPEMRRASSAVEDAFGFAEAHVVSFEDLYAGKLHAAVDRQHPRDLFDVKLLYENGGLTDDLFRTFLVYIAGSNRPPHELLSPKLQPIDAAFENELAGMTLLPVSVGDLDATRRRLHDDVRSRLKGAASAFVQSLVQGAPDFDVIAMPQARALPAIRWKLQNIEKLKATNPEKHREQVAALEALLL